MAGYSVTVCLPPEAATDVRAAIARAMAPFGPDSRKEWSFSTWDSWGVREGSGFWLRPGAEDDPRLLEADPQSDGSVPRRSTGRCVGGPRELLDFSDEPELGWLLAYEAWDTWEALPAARREELRARGTSPAPRAFPLDQLLEARRKGWNRFDFAETSVRRLRGGHDLLTLDGWWIEGDGAAHHAPCGTGCEHSPSAFDRARHNASIDDGMFRYLESLPGDALVVEVRGHC